MSLPSQVPHFCWYPCRICWQLKTTQLSGNLFFIFDVKPACLSLIQCTSPSLNLIWCVTILPFVYPHHFISIPAVSALLVAYSPVHPGAFVHATEHMISIIAGPDKTGSITHPDSARCFLLHKWIQARALDQATQCIAPRLDCHTVQTFLMMQAHPQAPWCFHTLPTSQPHHHCPTLVIRHLAAVAVSWEHWWESN